MLYVNKALYLISRNHNCLTCKHPILLDVSQHFTFLNIPLLLFKGLVLLLHAQKLIRSPLIGIISTRSTMGHYQHQVYYGTFSAPGLLWGIHSQLYLQLHLLLTLFIQPHCSVRLLGCSVSLCYKILILFLVLEHASVFPRLKFSSCSGILELNIPCWSAISTEVSVQVSGLFIKTLCLYSLPHSLLITIFLSN